MSRPVIGIVGRCETNDLNYPTMAIVDYYRNAILKNGAIPIGILPPQQIEYFNQRVSETAPLTTKEKEILDKQLSFCDGILLPGGYKTFEYDNYIIEQCIKNDKPILGICLGMQVMASYGKKRDNGMPALENEKNRENGINHRVEKDEVHGIVLDKNSKLYKIMKKEEFLVNSLHRYHVINPKEYKIVGYSEDNLIEAIEYEGNKFNIGVQWHPERLLYKEEENNLFMEFIKSCKE